MRDAHLHLLICPRCAGDLRVTDVALRERDQLITGRLGCTVCGSEFPLLRGVPRFVPAENYASSFGLEWTRHARTQYDSTSGLPLSAQRFAEETRWPRDLTGQQILEVGSGSGRFTEPAAATGAMVVSMDYSYAVEANFASNGDNPKVLVVQGDVYCMPFRPGTFDKLFCFGMLQHTPDARGAFMALPPMLKPGGELVVDVYKKTLFSTVLHTKYLVRPWTRRMDPERLYRYTRRWVDLMWPLCSVLRRIPRLGRSINWRLLVADYSAWGLKGDLLKEWAYLDTFDMLAPRYDSPQTRRTVRNWFVAAGLTDIDVHYGYNGVEGRGAAPR